MYKPDEQALLAGLAARKNSRDVLFASLMSMSTGEIESAALNHGLRRESSESHYSLAIRIVEHSHPELDMPIADSPSDWTTRLGSDYQVAQPPHDMSRYADLVTDQIQKIDDSTKIWQDLATGGFLHGPDWMNEGPAFVGFKMNDGTVQLLDLEGLVSLSGLHADNTKASVVLVSLANFFDGDYIKEFVGRLYAVLTGPASNRADLSYEIVSELLSQQGSDFAQTIINNAALANGGPINESNRSWPDSRSDAEGLDEPSYGMQAADVTQQFPKIEPKETP